MSSQASRTFEAVVMPHLDAAYNLARWLVGDATLAQDIVQDAVLRALGYFGSYRGGEARAWLLRIVRNAAYDTLASSRRTTSLDMPPGQDCGHPVGDAPDPAPDPEMALRRREDLEGLKRMLATLPAELRECIVLRELEELSYREIASVAGVPIGTVMSRLWRARQILSGHAEEKAP